MIPTLAGDAGNEGVGLVVWHGGHGEHFAGIDVHDDGGAPADTADDVFDEELFACVERELDLRSDAGLGVVRHADGAAFLIFDDGFAALGSGEILVHAGLDAGDSLVVSNVVVDIAGGAFGHVAFFPLLEVSDDVAGE